MRETKWWYHGRHLNFIFGEWAKTESTIKVSRSPRWCHELIVNQLRAWMTSTVISRDESRLIANWLSVLITFQPAPY